MLDRCAHCAPLLVLSLASVLGLSACGGGGGQPTEAKPTETKKAPQDEAKEPTKVDSKAAEGPAEPEPSEDAAGKQDIGGDAAEGGAAPAEGGEGEEAGGEEDAGADGDPAGAEAEGGEEAEGGAEAGGEDGAADEGGEASGKDSAALIKEARTTKTTDERALEALTEAEAAGATVKELARAAKARGDYLYKDPDRAKVFYEWSAAKDEDYADPVFALAKQKAVTGDVADVVKLLTQVAERKGGKKLLEQIDFDPTWDIVKDDPEVRALL